MHERTDTYRIEHLAIAVTLLFDVVVLVDVAVLRLPLVRAVLGYVFLTFVIGGVFLKAIGIEPELRARWLAYAAGSGAVVIMAVGFLLNLLLPRVGVSDPIAGPPLVAGLSLATVGICAASVWRFPGADRDFRVSRDAVLARIRRDGRALGLVALIPVGSVLAVEYLNVANDPTPLLAVLAVVAVAPFFVVVELLDERHLSFTVWATALAILYHKSLWAGHIYGGHASVVGIYERGVWTLTGEELLQNTILMPGYAHVTGVEIITQMEVIMPAIVVFIPVALYVTFQSYAAPPTAYLGAALFTFAHPFYFQYPSGPRASIPVLFLALVGLVISSDEARSVPHRALAMLFGAGIAVSHYGTSYYVLFALIAALAVLFQFRVIDRILAWRSGRDVSADGGVARGSLSELRSPDVLRPDFVAFYAIVVSAWYYYIDRSSRFLSVSRRIVESFRSLLAGPERGGVTAARLSTDYGGLSIRYGKYLYALVALLCGIGLGLAFLRRYVPRLRSDFSDDHLAVTAAIFLLFGVTFISAGQWGGGRPVMIVLSFSGIFAATAMSTAGEWAMKGCVRAAEYVSDGLGSAVRTASGSLSGRAALAVILAVFLLLNTGFMAAVAYGGEAPSNVPQTDVDTIDLEYHLDMYAWLSDHRDDTYEIYGDRVAWAQSTDWMNGEVAARSARQPFRFGPRNFFSALDDPTLERGYVLFLSHNIEEDRVEVDYVRSRPLSAYNLRTEGRNVVYSNGKSRVYFVGNATQRIVGGGAPANATSPEGEST